MLYVSSAPGDDTNGNPFTAATLFYSGHRSPSMPDDLIYNMNINDSHGEEEEKKAGVSWRELAWPWVWCVNGQTATNGDDRDLPTGIVTNGVMPCPAVFAAGIVGPI